MRHDQPYVETVLPGGCNLRNGTKKTITNPETWILRISIKSTSSISNTNDTKPSPSTDQSDSQTQIMRIRHGPVINSTSRHHWRWQVGIQVKTSLESKISLKQDTLIFTLQALLLKTRDKFRLEVGNGSGTGL